MENIRIYVFYEPDNQATHTNAQSVWADLVNSYENAEYIFGVDVSQEGAEGLLSDFQVKKIPSVVFVEVIGPQEGKTIARIEGGASYNKIKDVYQKVLTGFYDTGSGSGDSDTIIQGDAPATSYGFGLTNWNFGSIWPMVILAGLIYYSLKKR